MVNKLIYKWSLEKWQNLVNTGVLQEDQVELIDGKIINMSPERADHAFYTGKLVRILRALLEQTNKAVVREAHPITFTNSEPEPDIAVVRSPDYLYLQHNPYPEDIYWLIEVSRSTLKFDLNEKLKIYAQARISEYWVLDLNKYEINIFREPDPKKKEYRKCQVISEEEKVKISLPSFSDLSVNSHSIWRF